MEIIPRQGAFICDYRRKGTIETLVAIMRFNGGILHPQELVSLLEVRKVMERLCLELVMAHASDDQLQQLAPLVEGIRSAKTEEDCTEAVYTFHHELAVLSNNTLLPLLYHSFKPESIQLWASYVRYNSIQSIYAIKLELYRKILNRDPSAATQEPGEYWDVHVWQTRKQ